MRWHGSANAWRSGAGRRTPADFPLKNPPARGKERGSARPVRRSRFADFRRRWKADVQVEARVLVCRSLRRTCPGAAAVDGAGARQLAALRRVVRPDGRRRRLHGVLRLSDRAAGQPGLRPEGFPRHRRARHPHRRAVRGEGSEHLRQRPGAVADQQSHRRAKSAQGIRQAAQREHRLYHCAAFLRVHCPNVGRSFRGKRGAQHADHGGGPRFPVPGRPHRGDGDPGSGDVDRELHRRAARHAGAAQADPPHP